MQRLLKTWLSIALLTEKPHVLPGDQRSLKFTLVAAIITNVFATFILVDSRFLLVEALLDIVLAGSCLFVGLSAWGKSERFIQSFSAYCGVGVVLNIASIVMLGPIRMGQSPDTAVESVSHIGRFLEYLFLVWSIAAVAHIIRHSFEISLPFSVVSAILYVLVYILLAGFILAI